MTSQEQPSTRDLTLDELTVLCEVMVAICRAGVPLDRGLVQLAQDLPGKLGPEAKQISSQLQKGASLAEVVSGDGSSIPAVYASVVEAGIRSGRPTIALEGFARLARQLAELRRLVISALVYPMVLMVVLAVISVTVLQQLPAALEGFLDSHFLGTSTPTNYHSVMSLYRRLAQWFWIVPIGMMGVGIFWIWATQSAKAAETDHGDWLAWVPGARRLLRNSRLWSFTDVLKLLVAQDVPLHQAVRLAGRASGDRNLRADAAELAVQLEQGMIQVQTNNRAARHGIPSFLRWSLSNHQRVGKLNALLERASRTYRYRTDDAATWLRTFLPVCASVCLGGFVALIYASLLLIPWFGILRLLATPLRFPG